MTRLKCLLLLLGVMLGGCYTPWLNIWEATKKGDLYAVKCHLFVGTDVDVQAKNGKTPLHLAAFFNHIDIVALLIEKKCDVNDKDNSGKRPLHLAADRGHVDVAELLLENGADVSLGDDDGLTPLHLSVLDGRVEMSELLIEKGADVNARDSDGETPLDLAESTACDEIAEFLRKHGAKTGDELLTPEEKAAVSKQPPEKSPK